jgi:hypothetical protein
MEENELLIQLKGEIADLKKLIVLTTTTSSVSDKWLPKARVMEFLNYGNTQMAAFEKNSEIIVTRIGKRKFIRRDSLEAFLNKNTVKS